MKASLKLMFIFFAVILFYACALNPYQPPVHQTSTHSPNAPRVNPPPPTPPTPPSSNPITSSSRRNVMPYELLPDTISALTCPFPQFIGSHISSQSYSLSVASYYHGLQLSKEFKNEHDIKKGTDSRKISHLLQNSPFKNARALLSLRTDSDLAPLTLGGSGGGSGEAESLFPPLYSNGVIDQLSRQQKTLLYRSFNRRGVSSGFFKTLFTKLSSSTLINIGQELGSQGRYLLTVIYNNNNIKPVRHSNGQPYGRGYKLDFNDSIKTIERLVFEFANPSIIT